MTRTSADGAPCARGLRVRARRAAGLLALALLAAAPSSAVEPVVTVLADFDGDSVAASVVEVQRALASECTATTAQLPARGQRSLELVIAATGADASVACDLIFRTPLRFEKPERVAAFAWIHEGSASLAFRVRDEAGRIHETPLQAVGAARRWTRVEASLAPSELGLGAAAPSSLEVVGVRVATTGVGRQAVYVDDLEVEHRVPVEDVLVGSFTFEEATHILEPGATARGAFELENRSRQLSFDVSVVLQWISPDGSVIDRQTSVVRLPVSGRQFRSRQPVSFAQRLRTAGLYRVVAEVQAARWTAPRRFDAGLAVLPTNRLLARGRSVFFGVRTNLLREPLGDQMTEIRAAREIGVQLLALETPWRMVETRPGAYTFSALDPVVEAVASRDMALLLMLTEPPGWLAGDALAPHERQALVLEALIRHYGARVQHYQPLGGALLAEEPHLGAERLRALQERASRVHSAVQVISPPTPLAASTPPEPGAAGAVGSFETEGDSIAALAEVDRIAERAAGAWPEGAWWFHRADPPGRFDDASAASDLLAQYVGASKLRAASLVWFDLRDDAGEGRGGAPPRGLMRRDFSPKATLLALAATIGNLSGTRYSGPLGGAPAEFDSAILLASNRQVGVLLPKPNRELPAAAGLELSEAAVLRVVDLMFHEREVRSGGPLPLVPLGPRPLLLNAEFSRIQAESRIALARPWLRVPATVFCGSRCGFRIEIDAPGPLRKSHLTLSPPPEAPFTSSVGTRSLRRDAGGTIALDVELAPIEGRSFDRSALILKLNLEGSAFELPLEVCRLVDVRAGRTQRPLSVEEHRIGALEPSKAGAAGGESLAIAADFDADALRLGVALPKTWSDQDEFTVGVALEQAARAVVARIAPRGAALSASAVRAEESAAVGSWNVRVAGEARQMQVCELRIPASSLGVARLADGVMLRCAIEFVGAAGADVRTWGVAPESDRSGSLYRWLRLTGNAGDGG